MEQYKNWGYSATRDEKVYSHKSKRFLKLCEKGGYYNVKLTHEGKSYTKRAHHIIAEVFLPNPEKLAIVHHKNNNRFNNNVENLEWSTQKKISQKVADENLITHYKRPVFQIEETKTLTEINNFSSIPDAVKHSGIDKNTIWNCCKKDNFTPRKHREFMWKYADPENVIRGQPAPVIQYRVDYKENIIKRYESVTDAGKEVGTGYSNIIGACRDNYRCLGYIWKYETERKVPFEEVKDWKEIPGFTRYLISTNGEIYSTILKIILKIQKSEDGYLAIGLVDDNGEKRCSIGVHILVAKTYIENPKKLPEVNHLDGNKENNSVKNLEWCTGPENILHALDTELNKSRKKIVKYTFDGNFVEEYRSVKEASENNSVDKFTITRSCKRKKPLHNGDRFFYKGEEEFDLYFKSWKLISGYDNYLISRNGKIYSKARDCIIKQSLSDGGKYMIGLPEGSREVHRIVAEIYIPNPEKYKYVIHKNGDKLDNTVDNLQWAKTIKIPTKPHPFGMKKAVFYVDKEGKEHHFSSMKEAGDNIKANPSSISRVCNKPGRTCKGFEWKYFEE